MTIHVRRFRKHFREEEKKKPRSRKPAPAPIDTTHPPFWIEDYPGVEITEIVWALSKHEGQRQRDYARFVSGPVSVVVSLPHLTQVMTTLQPRVWACRPPSDLWLVVRWGLSGQARWAQPGLNGSSFFLVPDWAAVDLGDLTTDLSTEYPMAYSRLDRRGSATFVPVTDRLDLWEV